MKLFIEAGSITSPRMSGVGHTCLEIIRVLDNHLNSAHELQVIAIVPFGKKDTLRRYNFKNIRVRSLWPGGKVINYLFTRTILPIPVDVWFGKGIYLFPDYKNWWVPYSYSMTFIYDVAFRLFPDTIHEKNRRYLEANMTRWLRRTNRVLCISKAAANEFCQQFPSFEQKVRVVYLGVDPSIYRPRPSNEVANIVHKYNLPSHYFLFVGNIEPRKNLEVLLDAYQQYGDSHKQTQALVLVGGDGWRNEKIKEKIKTLQKAGFPVYHPEQYIPDEDLPALFSGATALVHVAVHEGFGLPPVQAQACGTPVIASDLPVLREVLSRKTTSFIPPNDVKAIAEALSHQSDHFIGGVDFTWERTVDTILGLIKEGR